MLKENWETTAQQGVATPRFSSRPDQLTDQRADQIVEQPPQQARYQQALHRPDRMAIARVLRSLLRAHLEEREPADLPLTSDGRWPEELRIDDAAGLALGADSLDRIELAALVNEYFHIHEAGIEDYLLAKRQLGEWLDIVEHALRSGVDRVTFRTSGSTGQPKACTHDLARLGDEVDVWARLFATRRRIVAAVPAHHIFGFVFTALLPNRLGCPVIDTHDDFARTTAVLQPGDLVVSIPERWRYFARSLPWLPEDVVGVTATGPIDRMTAIELRDRGLADLLDVYGASETGGIGFGRAGEGQFKLLSTWRRTADAALQRLADGQIVTPPDALSFTAPRRFQLAGRRDAAVQIGGINVFPAEIAARLRAHRLVADCRVRLCDRRRRLKAFVVPADPDGATDALQATLRRWCARNLSVPERPQAYAFGSALPLGDTGKDKDW